MRRSYRFASWRTYLIITVLVIVTVIYAIGVMLHMALFRDREVFYRYARSWSRLLLDLSGVDVTLEGVNHLEPGTRYVYASNHASLFDIPVVLATIPDNIRIMYKRELEKIPVFGWCLRMSPFIAVNRARSREAAGVLDATVESMSSGTSVLVFPEGTRSDDGTLGVFKRGAVSLAVKSGTPIVPVTMIGTAAVMPARTRKLVGGSVTLHLDAPLSVDGVTSSADEKALTATLREIIDARLRGTS